MVTSGAKPNSFDILKRTWRPSFALGCGWEIARDMARCRITRPSAAKHAPGVQRSRSAPGGCGHGEEVLVAGGRGSRGCSKSGWVRIAIHSRKIHGASDPFLLDRGFDGRCKLQSQICLYPSAFATAVAAKEVSTCGNHSIQFWNYWVHLVTRYVANFFNK